MAKLVELKIRIPASTYKELTVDAKLHGLTTAQFLRKELKDRIEEHCYCDVCGSVIPEIDGELSMDGADRIYISQVVEKMLLTKGYSKQKSLARAVNYKLTLKRIYIWTFILTPAQKNV